MSFNFDEQINRLGTDSAKWSVFGDDVLPMWVADMDFRAPQPVIDALAARVATGVFGYGNDARELRETVKDRMAARYDWAISADDVILLPGIVTAFNAVFRTFGAAGDEVAIFTPNYHPFFPAIENAGLIMKATEMRVTEQDQVLHYEIDFDALEASITPKTKVFLLCNPHNPIGRVYTREELQRIADICIRHDLIICSDEIHSDLILEGKHTPIASLSPEVGARTITLIAASKTFNTPGLAVGFAISENPELLTAIKKTMEGIVPYPNILGVVATEAAYREGDAWLVALLDYVRGNRDLVLDYVRENLPGVSVTQPEGTYLLWMDCRALNLSPSPFEFFLKEAKVAFTDGAGFAGDGFVRWNLGCPRANVIEALDRVTTALRRAQTAQV